MTTFCIEIAIDNDAFQPLAGPEIARILRKYADQIDDFGSAAISSQPLRDINGNSVGFVFIEED